MSSNKRFRFSACMILCAPLCKVHSAIYYFFGEGRGEFFLSPTNLVLTLTLTQDTSTDFDKKKQQLKK